MRKTPAIAALLTAAALVLTGCGSTAAGQADDGRVQVVASTNVYGSLAAQIGGDQVDVTSLIDSKAQDPHSFEATARDRLAVQHADLIIENGGGYDPFMEQLRDGSDAAVITAAEFSHDYPGATVKEDDHSKDHEGHSHIEGFNEHVWFDVHTITHVVERITTDLTKLDPAGKAGFAARAEKVTGELTALQADLDALHAKHEGQKVFITEPLPGLLAAAAGLDDVAPDGFASAVEEGDDVAPAILLDALHVVEGGEVRAVLTTAQTGGSETTRVTDAAKRAGIPVVTFSELLGPDQTYAQWMRSAIDDLSAALDR
ncbi:zinc ABC transporter substrate-binding protein [uncultured Microbacterium sp.]|uniref:metal ABC transporter solute-binding protein, Zn/Mn family n=1 Tax=uncultured Microbacterium sp. TaxID=191216 RepID=UPI00262E71E2|nr:zinc ABC transporter substrate-binding protein [uncultured Microbacterium sp.]